MSGHVTRSCLRKLDLHVWIPLGFDVLSIIYMLNASPFLEILNLKVCLRAGTIERQGGEYGNCSHFRLKEAKIEGFSFHLNTLILVLCLLTKAVALEHMIIKTINGCSKTKQTLTSLLQKNIITTRAQVIIQ
ncbi:hypothetical protein DM860_003028 [Cuscuta australis]|uniref:At1g61320/AtMIF1 LRR domain-containing protein n=1 Tax=Cuscuta australis TaxID=267555 RepID=A0A328D164_9ASTE|nr:hypothetical protein DM860_003028 [Cuscuta australis]